MLRSDTTALFERLREANIMLQEVLSGSHENMSALENTLMLRVSEFVTAMNEVTASTGDATDRVEANIANFREITTHVVTDLGQLASHFDDHGRELAKAAEQIDASNQRTEDTVNERRAQLDSLVATLDIRTEDIEQRLKRFSGLLDESLEAASTRAREVARLVSESSAEGTRAISEQYERVRENAEHERERTAETMRSVYQQTTAEADALFRDANERFTEVSQNMRAIYDQSAGDTHSMFRDASQRFAETVQAMKQMAGEMQRELENTRLEMQRQLESTRAELRRGVFELPQETAESAAQMRRVIVDQIEALAELNRIVARHGRNLDAVEPVQQQRRSREEPTLAVIGGRSEVARQSEAAPPMPPRAMPPRPERPEVANFAPAARRAAEAPSLSPVQPQPQPANAGRGWLSDLLTRASREEPEAPREMQRDLPREPAPLPMREAARGPEERSPRHSIESLDSLSVDIARMIDHDAAADLWDRYKRGERNVFTRRLYTLQGQQAFDEIRKKYRTEREFKQTVDRYIGEFERLLEEVSRDDRGQVVARTYLTSETGKVYTMLAHAAGRFD
jgi:ABC-type transporter Mla subunit MlaD